MADFFINPAFLAGAAAAALPVIIHLLSRRRFKRVQWAAMEFLLRAHKKTHQRLRIENLLVLFLRAAAVALLAAALARPVAKQASVIADIGEKNRMVFLVVDNSYSMNLRRGQTTPMDKAKKAAGDLAGSLKNGSDSAALILASSMTSAVFGEPTPDIDRVREEIGNISASCGRSDLRPAMGLILEALENPQVANAPNKSIYILTDMQRAAWTARAREGEGENALESLLGRLAPAVDSIHVIDVGFEQTDNCAVTSLETDDKIIGIDKPASFTVTVENHGQARVEDVNVELFVDGHPKGNKVVSVDPRSASSVSFTTTFREPGPRSLAAQITADNLPDDDIRHLAVAVREELNVLLVDGEPFEEGERGFFSSETAYLKLALMPSEDGGDPSRASVIKPETRNYFEVNADTAFGKYQVVVLANEGRLVTTDFDVVDALEGYVRGGGALLICLGDRIKADDYNARLFREGEGLMPLKLAEIRHAEGRLFSIKPSSFAHPVMAVFNDTELRKLVTAPYTSAYFRLIEEGAQAGVGVIARFDDAGEPPALAEKPLGHGRVMVLATSCDREWTKIPANFVFLPLVHEMVYYLASEAGSTRNIIAGGTIQKTLTQQEYSENVSVVLPSGGRPALEPPRKIGNNRFSVSYGPADQAGIYELRLEGAKPTRDLFAVNLDPAESDISRVPVEDLKSALPLQVRSKLSFSESVETGARQEVAGGSEFWRHIVVIVIIFLALETVLAQRFGNYAR